MRIASKTLCLVGIIGVAIIITTIAAYTVFAQQSPSSTGITLSAPKNLWLPLKIDGTGFSGEPRWATPVVEIQYSKSSFTGSTAVEAIEMTLVDDKGKEVALSLFPEVDITASAGTLRVWFEDGGIFGYSTYSGAGKIRVYLKENKDAKNPISNIIEIPVAADSTKQKNLEAKLGPAPKSLI